MAASKRTGVLAFMGLSVCTASAVLLCLGAAAQPGGPGRAGMDPAKAAAAWKAEAETVAKSLNVDEGQAVKLVEAYKAARESHSAAVRARMDAGGDRRDYGAMMEINKAEKAKLEAALLAFLTPEQTATALSTLGTFNRRWDSMALAIEGMTLEAGPKAEAMDLIMAYVAEWGKVTASATPGAGDNTGMREKAVALREKLDADLAKVLSAEQMAAWKEATAMREGSRGGRGGLGGGPGGGVGAGGGAGGGPGK